MMTQNRPFNIKKNNKKGRRRKNALKLSNVSSLKYIYIYILGTWDYIVKEDDPRVAHKVPLSLQEL